MEIRIVFDPTTGRVQAQTDMGPGTTLRVLEVALQAQKDKMFASEQQPIQLAPASMRLPFPNGPKK